mgnify:CR=1 FL=1
MTNDKGILIRNIYYMLAYAFQELRQNNYSEIAGEDFEEIHDLFAEILIRGVSYQLKQGLHRRYVPFREASTTLHGKLDMDEAIRQKIRHSGKIACEYDELSVNNLFNQILVSTATILLKHSGVKKDKKAELKRLLLFFSDVDAIDVKTFKWSTLRFDRNTRNYRMLLYIFYFIIDGMLLTTESGQYKMREFSDDHMHRLYERFVLEYYRRHHPQTNARSAQIDWNIDKEVSSTNILPIMQTDIFLTIGERTLIIDTKYYGKTMQYQFDKATIHSNNLNQIYAYVTNHDTGHTGKVDGMLLYAKTQEEIVPDGSMTLTDGNTIYFKTLDLNSDFKNICRQLDGFVNDSINNVKRH